MSEWIFFVLFLWIILSLTLGEYHLIFFGCIKNYAVNSGFSNILLFIIYYLIFISPFLPPANLPGA